MSGAVPLLPHLPVWQGQEQLYLLQLNYIMPYLRFSLQRFTLIPNVVHVGFMVVEAVMGQVFSWHFSFSPSRFDGVEANRSLLVNKYPIFYAV